MNAWWSCSQRKETQEEKQVGVGERTALHFCTVDNHVGPRVRLCGFKSLLCHLLHIIVMTMIKILIHFIPQFPNLKKLRIVLSS